VDQHPSPRATVFRGRTVDVDLLVTEAYHLVCRGGGSLRALSGDGALQFEKYGDKASADMTEGSYAWIDRKLSANEDSLLRPLGFEEQLQESFSRAPGGFLVFCAFTRYDDATKSPHLVALSYENYMIRDDNGKLQPAMAVHICEDHMP
jgi:hypothetical protein